MKPRYLIFLILFIISCKHSANVKESTSVKVPNTIPKVIAKEVVKTVDLCSSCERLFQTFPKDSANFEFQYGYPNGTRQQEAYDDIEKLFNCFTKCQNQSQFEAIVKLSSLIKYDADGPTYLQTNLITYIENNKELVIQAYSKIDCSTFIRHINFLFQGIESDSKIKEIENLLVTLKLNDNCKVKALSNILNSIENDY